MSRLLAQVVVVVRLWDGHLGSPMRAQLRNGGSVPSQLASCWAISDAAADPKACDPGLASFANSRPAIDNGPPCRCANEQRDGSRQVQADLTWNTLSVFRLSKRCEAAGVDDELSSRRDGSDFAAARDPTETHKLGIAGNWALESLNHYRVRLQSTLQAAAVPDEEHGSKRIRDKKQTYRHPESRLCQGGHVLAKLLHRATPATSTNE